MGTRALQLFMIVLLAGCLGWSSAIFFGPWAMTKYLESQFGDAVEVSGLNVTPKLSVTASRIVMSGGGANTASLRVWRSTGGYCVALSQRSSFRWRAEVSRDLSSSRICKLLWR